MLLKSLLYGLHFRIFDEKKDFERAKKDCTGYDGFLIEIEDPDTKDFIARRYSVFIYLI